MISYNISKQIKIFLAAEVLNSNGLVAQVMLLNQAQVLNQKFHTFKSVFIKLIQCHWNFLYVIKITRVLKI